ncbi:hypothetical protein DFH06DRAFT_1291537, partial [Mycena polygramma]
MTGPEMELLPGDRWNRPEFVRKIPNSKLCPTILTRELVPGAKIAGTLNMFGTAPQFDRPSWYKEFAWFRPQWGNRDHEGNSWDTETDRVDVSRIHKRHEEGSRRRKWTRSHESALTADAEGRERLAPDANHMCKGQLCISDPATCSIKLPQMFYQRVRPVQTVDFRDMVHEPNFDRTLQGLWDNNGTSSSRCGVGLTVCLEEVKGGGHVIGKIIHAVRGNLRRTCPALTIALTSHRLFLVPSEPALTSNLLRIQSPFGQVNCLIYLTAHPDLYLDFVREPSILVSKLSLPVCSGCYRPWNDEKPNEDSPPQKAGDQRRRRVMQPNRAEETNTRTKFNTLCRGATFL